MANKKLTPIQEAINLVKELKFDQPRSVIEGLINKDIDDCLKKLVALLPKEKEFAREMFGAGQEKREAIMLHDMENLSYDDMNKVPDFDTVFKQYEQ